MTQDVHRDLQKDQFRAHFLTYTRRAYQMLPELEIPAILDIGCGTGVPTLELARLSSGRIIGLDVDQECLAELTRKAEAAGLADRVKTMHCSLLALEFPNETFDLIWAEGSIAIIGFERGLKEWRRLLKPDGFLVVHDEIGNLRQKLHMIPASGYALLGHFTLSAEIWWQEYYGPLEERIRELRAKYRNDPRALAVLDAEHREAEMVKRSPERYASVFFVLQKSERAKTSTLR
jgi:ubiquinone/menaquinone biosynthesis C-methylase UbiE